MGFDPISSALDLGSKLIERLFPDPAQKAAAQLELLKLQQSGELTEISGQLEINKVEASNPNMFISGWRPFIGWVCGTALVVQYIVRPFLPSIPSLDMETLMPLVVTLLGMAGYRTFEKTKGVAAR
jgi:hypothetical protein